MIYVQIRDGVAIEIIPEFSPDFPGVPITDRYASSFLALCVAAEDSVQLNDIYDPETGVFCRPPEEGITPDEGITGETVSAPSTSAEGESLL